MTEQYRNIKNTTLLRLAASLTLILALFVFVSYISYKNELVSTLSDETKHLESFFNSELNLLNERNFTRIDNMLSNDDVLKAIEERDRNKLYSLVKNSYDLFSRENRFFKNMHFHTENTVTILRVHKPEQYGDDLSKIRTIIASANRQKLPESGLEVGINGIFYRVVQPVLNKERKHIGCVEFGIDPMYFTHLMETIHGDKKLAFVFNEHTLDLLNNKDDVVSFGKKYILTDSPDFFRNLLPNLVNKNMTTYEDNGRTYLAAPVLQLKDYSRNDIASLVAAIDITYKVAKIRYNVFILLVFGVIIASATLTVANIGFNTYIRKLDKTNDTLKKAVEELTYTHNIIDQYVIYSEADANGTITKVSSALCDISQFSQDELIGSQHTIIKHPDVDQNISRQMWNTIMAGKSWNGDIKNIKKDGTLFWVNAHIIPKIDDNGKFLGYSSIRTDISDKKRVEELTITDDHTSLYNKRYFNQILDLEMRRAHRNRSYITLAIIDIDHFKLYNDTYGHLKGDKVLKRIAMTIKKSLNRAGDYAFRIGGEEFAVVCMDMPPQNSAVFFEQMRGEVKNLGIEHTSSETAECVTISIGIYTTIPAANTTPNTAYRKADTALYNAKQTGRNRVCSYEDSEA